MVKVVQKAVGMTPVVDLIKEAAAHHSVGHVQVDQTAQHTAIRSLLVAATAATVVDQIGQPTVIGSRSLAGTVGKADRTAHSSANHLLAVTGSRSLAETAGKAGTAQPTEIRSHFLVATVARAGQIGQRMAIGSHLTAMVATVQLTEIGSHLLAGTAGTAYLIGQLTATGSHSLAGTAAMVIDQPTATVTTDRENHLTKKVATGQNVSHSLAETAAKAVIGQPTATGSRPLAETAAKVVTVQHMETVSRSLAETAAKVVIGQRMAIASRSTAKVVIDQPTAIASHLTAMAGTAAMIGQPGHAKATAPVLIAATARKGLKSVHSSASRSPATGMTMKNVHASSAAPKVMSQATVQNVSHSIGMTALPATRMVRPGHGQPALANHTVRIPIAAKRNHSSVVPVAMRKRRTTT